MTSGGMKKFLWVFALVIVISLAGAALLIFYLQRRGPAAGPSNYPQVNDKVIRDWIVMETEYPDYAPDTEVIKIMITNHSATEPLSPAEDRKDEWILEIYDDHSGEWRKVRHTGKNLCWDFPRRFYGQEAYGEDIRPSGTVPGGGGNLIYLCNLWAYYDLPLQAGQYRVIFPNMMLASRHDLAAEFIVRDMTPEELEERENIIREGWSEEPEESELPEEEINPEEEYY